MIKSELIIALSKTQNEIAKEDIEAAINCILDQMSKTLTVGGHVEIRGFGSFTLNYQEPRTARNPKTGERIHIQGKNRIRFKPGKELRDRVNASNHT